MINVNNIIDRINNARKYYKKVKKKDKGTLRINNELESIFEEIKKENIDEEVVLQVQKRWNDIKETIEHFKNILPETMNRHKHFFLQNIYNIISQLKFIVKGDILTEIDEKGRKYIKSYIKSGFCVFEDKYVKDIMLDNLLPIFDRLNNVCKTDYEEAPDCI